MSTLPDQRPDSIPEEVWNHIVYMEDQIQQGSTVSFTNSHGIPTASRAYVDTLAQTVQTLAQDMAHLTSNMPTPIINVPTPVVNVTAPTSSTSSSRTPAVRLSDPVKFDGKAKHIINFINECEVRFIFQADAFNSDCLRSLYIGNMIETEVKGWFSSIQHTNPTLLDNYTDFIRQFREFYGNSNK